MTINYEEWNREDLKTTREFVNRALDKLRTGKKLTPLDMVPDLGIKEQQPYTSWIHPGSPEMLNKHPQYDLRNIETIYASKKSIIIVPIAHYRSHSDFKYAYGMSVEDMISYIQANPDHLRPVLGEAPIHYQGTSFYHKLFMSCRKIYGRYPIFTSFRISALQEMSRATAEGERVYGLKYSMATCIRDAEELFKISRKTLRDMSKYLLQTDEDTIRMTASKIQGLRICGFERLADLSLKLGILNHPLYSWAMLQGYTTHLIDPLQHALGGFTNLDLTDLEQMAFLRLFPLETVELKEAFLQSPAARSFLLRQGGGCEINIFKGGTIDPKSLNAIIELAEKYPEIGERLADYHKRASSGDLARASKSAQLLSEVLVEQYNKEYKEWQKRERIGKMMKGMLDYGASLIILPRVLLEGIPKSWELALLFAIEMFKRKVYPKVGTLDPKEIVEKLWRVKDLSLIHI